MTLSNLFVKFTAAIFIVYGLAFVIEPTQLAVLITETSPVTSVGLIDMRATYGGMSLGVGGVLLLLSMKPETLRMGLAAVFLLMLGMAGGRLVGILVDGSATVTMHVYFVLEVVAAVVALLLLKKDAAA